MEKNSNFIKTIIKEDLKSKKHDAIITRFPPEPSGYLHIGHAKAIVTNFELAKEFNGITNLRFDDTNPEKESDEYVRAIKEDIKWLGYEPNDIFFASDYFDEMFERAIILIKKDLAFVCDLTQEEVREYHGDVTKVGTISPYRNRTIEENLELFNNMKNGVYKTGEKTLRAKIDMAHPNMNMRDPVVYRINHIDHHNTGSKWCIYPMYDFAHPLEDAIEGITHSLCSLEFEDHRPLYDWYVEQTEMPLIPRQIEFGRINIENAILSKRYMKQLVDNKIVENWDDPRMSTISGYRRRGFTANAIKECMLESGLSKVNSTMSSEFLEHFVRQDLAVSSPVIMGVVDPVLVIIENLDEDHIEYVEGANHPKDESFGTRKIAFTKELYIEREDFEEEKPNRKWKRGSIGNEVRLRHAYFIKPNKVEKDASGKITKIYATYDKETKSGSGFTDRKPDGTIHFVSAKENKEVTFNIINPLIIGDFNKENFLEKINPNSLEIQKGYIEDTVNTEIGTTYQLIRKGYFNIDTTSTNTSVVMNRVVSLKGKKI